MKKVSIGPCPLCNKRIWKFVRPAFINFSKGIFSMAFKKLPYEQNDEGTHVWFLQNDRSKMRVAICTSCLEELNDEKVKMIFSDIIFTKLKVIENDKRLTEEKRYKLFDRIRDITVFKWARTEKELDNYLMHKEQ